MKLTKKLFGFIAIFAVIGFLALPLTVCSSPDDGGGGGGNTGDGTGYDMTGTYTFNNTYDCTWIFYSDGTYQCSSSSFQTKTGTWKSKGNDVTISFYNSSGSVTVQGEEVFTVRENGDQVTLTLKDNSALTSKVLVHFILSAKSVTLTKTNSSENTGGTGSTAPTITTTSLSGGTVGVAYSKTLTATGDEPITWSVESGVLPTGLTLASTTGVISGTPTAANTFSFIVKATNAEGSVTKSLSIRILLSVSGGGTAGETTSSSGIVMVSILGGTFTMDSHSVTLTGFKIGKYEVTQEQYVAVMGSNPSFFMGTGTALYLDKTYDLTPAPGEVQNKRPVEQVSWYEALVFCNKLSMAEGLSPAYRISGNTDPATWGTVPTSSNSTWNAVEVVSGSTGYRLPTEAQWEYACRAGTTTAYNTGATISDSTGWYTSNSGKKTHQVGLKPANAWGLYDMHGNVWEWCWDWYGVYASGAQTDPTGAATGIRRVVRGGGWYYGSYEMMSTFRDYYYPNFRDSNFGFRLVRP